jgi:drug/metabolite transporter (DMT)-like permease
VVENLGETAYPLANANRMVAEILLMAPDSLQANIPCQPRHPFRGFVLLLIAVAFWGTAAPFGKHLILTRFDTLTITQARTSLAFALLSLYFIVTDRKMFRVQIRDIWKFAVLGVVGLAITNFTYYFTVKEATVATAILVQYTAPVWVLLYSVCILKEETLDWTTVLSLVVALAGCYFTVTSGSFRDISLRGWALLTGPISAFTFAYYIVATKQLLKRYPMWTVLLYLLGSATIFWLFFNPPWNIVRKHYQAADWGFLWLFAIVSILIPQAAFTSGLLLIDASKAGIISILEPVIAISAAFFMLGESLNTVQILGACMVLGAIALLQIHPMILKRAVTN